jgi:hypothetical protein
MVITYHPSNPPFARILHTVYTDHKEQLPGNFSKPIVAHKRTKNLKEILTRAKFSNPPIQRQRCNGHEKDITKTIPRPITTYDKNQMTAHIKHILLQCKC